MNSKHLVDTSSNCNQFDLQNHVLYVVSLIQFQSLFRKHCRKSAALVLQRKPTINKSVNTEYYREASDAMAVNLNNLNYLDQERTTTLLLLKNNQSTL